MADLDTIQSLIDDTSIARKLKKGSEAEAEIKVLQEALFHLGFGKALNWDRYGPDGDYGASTARAVKQFAKANGTATDGAKVNTKLGRLLIKRYEFLDEMRHMQDAVNKTSLLNGLRYKSTAKLPITVLQNILHELGYDAEMNWAKYGADGEYGKGTAKAVKAFAEKHGIATDGRSVTKEMAEKSLEAFKGYYGPDWYKESPKLVRETLKVTESNKKVTVSDGTHTKAFGKYKRGLFTYGDLTIEDFIDANKADLKQQGMTESALNIMKSVSKNEGALDAINTWDSAFMTFGCFQWTIGQKRERGELPALFKKIKDADPGVFSEYYGRHGLDVWHGTNDTNGQLVLNGQIINMPEEKAQFRAPRWCFWFWKAGQDPLVQAVSVQHAFSRIGRFHRSPKVQINGHDVADVVTSEFGMALVLDNHVNRPAYIKACLTKAMDAAGLKGTDPAQWNTSDERKLIARYLEIRESYGGSPMTDAAGRARRTKKYLTDGVISDARGSFKI